MTSLLRKSLLMDALKRLSYHVTPLSHFLDQDFTKKEYEFLKYKNLFHAQKLTSQTLKTEARVGDSGFR